MATRHRMHSGHFDTMECNRTESNHYAANISIISDRVAKFNYSGKYRVKRISNGIGTTLLKT